MFLEFFHGQFSKRTYSSWRLVCSVEPSLNATFDSEVSAHARLRELTAQGHVSLKVKKFSSLDWQARARRKRRARPDQDLPST
jgi:hypothetical protein